MNEPRTSERRKIDGPRYAYIDWNSVGQRKDGLERLSLDSKFYFGLWPEIGDRVLTVDSDASCGSCEAVVERVEDGSAFVRMDRPTFKYWTDYPPATTTINGPDWLLRAFAAMGKPK